MYDKTNHRVEKMSKRMYFVMVQVVPQALTSPKFINNIYTYFSTNLDDAAFDLPLPMW